MSRISKSLEDVLNYDEDGELKIDGIHVAQITESQQTPTVVLSERRLKDNFRSMKETFIREYGDVAIAYSVKTNSMRHLLGLLHSSGSKVDVASPTEARLAGMAGFRPQEMIYNSPGIANGDLVDSVKQGMFINVDSISEYKSLEKVARKLKRKVDFGVRVKFAPKELGSRLLYTEAGPFGLTKDEVRELCMEASKSEFVKLTGIHSHMIIQQINPTAHEMITRELVDFLEELHKSGIELRYVNVGGGFGSRCLIENAGFPIGEFSRRICGELKKLPYSPNLIVEPGRYIVSDAFFGLAKVLRKKQVAQKNLLFTDFGTNILMPLQTALFDVYPARLVEKSEAVDVRGPMPFHADRIKENVELYAEEGDTLVITNIGAYTLALSNNFCGQLRPPVVSIQDGKLKVVQRRETLKDILLRDL